MLVFYLSRLFIVGTFATSYHKRLHIATNAYFSMFFTRPFLMYLYQSLLKIYHDWYKFGTRMIQSFKAILFSPIVNGILASGHYTEKLIHKIFLFIENFKYHYHVIHDPVYKIIMFYEKHVIVTL